MASHFTSCPVTFVFAWPGCFLELEDVQMFNDAVLYRFDATMFGVGCVSPR